jgi:hypothetical protein
VTAPEAPRNRLVSLADVLAHPERLQPPTAVIPGLAWAGRVTLLAGREKSGKSTLAAAACAVVSRGGYFLGEVLDAGGVVWLSSDQEAMYDIAARFQRFGALPGNIWLPEDWDRSPESFLRLVRENKSRVAVVDTLLPFAEMVVPDANSAALWSPLLLAIRRTAAKSGTAFVLLHHANRTTGRYRDSTALGASVDCICEMEGDDGSTVRKVRARARWPMDDYSLQLDGDTFHQVDTADLSPEARLLLYIEGHSGCSKLAVREAVGGRASDVDTWLDVLADRGAIEDRGTGNRHAYYRKGADKSGQPLGQVPAPDGSENSDARDTRRDKAGQVRTSGGTSALEPPSVPSPHTPEGVGTDGASSHSPGQPASEPEWVFPP